MSEKKPKNLWVSIHGSSGAGKTTFIESIKRHHESQKEKKFNHVFFIETTQGVLNQSETVGKNTFFYPLAYHGPVLNYLNGTLPLFLLSCSAAITAAQRFGWNDNFMEKFPKLASLVPKVLVGGALASVSMGYLLRLALSKILSSNWEFNVANYFKALELDEKEEDSVQTIVWFDRCLSDCWANNRYGEATLVHPSLPEFTVRQTERMSCSIIVDTPKSLVLRNLRDRAMFHPDSEIRKATKGLLYFPSVVDITQTTSLAVSEWNSAWGVPVIKTSELKLKKNDLGRIIWDDETLDFLFQEIVRVSSAPKVKSAEAEKLLEGMVITTKGHW